MKLALLKEANQLLHSPLSNVPKVASYTPDLPSKKEINFLGPKPQRTIFRTSFKEGLRNHEGRVSQIIPFEYSEPHEEKRDLSINAIRVSKIGPKPFTMPFKTMSDVSFTAVKEARTNLQNSFANQRSSIRESDFRSVLNPESG